MARKRMNSRPRSPLAIVCVFRLVLRLPFQSPFRMPSREPRRRLYGRLVLLSTHCACAAGKRQQGVPWEAGRRVRAGAGLLRMRRESEEKQDFLAAFSSVPYFFSFCFNFLYLFQKVKSEEDKRKIFGEYFFDCPEEFEFMPGHVDLLLDIGRKLKDVKKAIAPCRLFASTPAGGTSRATSGTSKRQADRLESSTDKVNRKSHALQYINVFGNLPCGTYNDGYELETRYSNRRVQLFPVPLIPTEYSTLYALQRHSTNFCFPFQ